eukprot:CAMPEP_0170589064 /NCGR_PEP_ID=MMETSP0224-20130122/11158_1 /TAXON_ID=285029 /ORGANISM="Togula jolla, Strain CCCM 725" /LENGTH=215 /DNA_ID=CAMNT_0010912811 /DNA_START=89 /DNA_END=736 /DNA_ORIENTATION=+
MFRLAADEQRIARAERVIGYVPLAVLEVNAPASCTEDVMKQVRAELLDEVSHSPEDMVYVNQLRSNEATHETLDRYAVMSAGLQDMINTLMADLQSLANNNAGLMDVASTHQGGTGPSRSAQAATTAASADANSSTSGRAPLASQNQIALPDHMPVIPLNRPPRRRRRGRGRGGRGRNAAELADLDVAQGYASDSGARARMAAMLPSLPTAARAA